MRLRVASGKLLPMNEGSPTAEPMADELNALFAQCLERMQDEGSAALEAMCRAHPRAAGALRRQVSTLCAVGLLPDDGPAELPARLGEFRLLKRLGGGGMGVVYLAEQESLRREVALKLIRPDHLCSPGAHERFRCEGLAVARLQHPGIVPVYAVGEEHGIPYYSMEHVAGHSLAAILRALHGQQPEALSGDHFARAIGLAAAKGHLFGASWVEVCFRIVQQVGEALDHAHQRGVIHRNLKPSNILITPTGRAMVVDFGLASAQPTRTLTRAGAPVCSLPYLSPEQLRGDVASIDHRTDVYSLGVTLYELLTLAPPYFSPDAEVTRKLILDGGSKALRTQNPAVPWDAETVCATAMDREPARRYASAAALAHDLKSVLDLRPIQARRASMPLRLRRWTERHPAVSVALVLGSLLVLGGPSVLWLMQRNAGEILRQKNVDLERANIELGRLLKSAADTAQVARRNIGKARAAVDQILARVGDETLRSAPVAGVERELLEKAVLFYRGFLSEAAAEHDLRLETSQDYRKLGDLELKLGNSQAAAQAYQQSLSLLERRAGEPDSLGGNADDESRSHWAEASIGLAVALLRQGDLEASEAILRATVARCQEFAASGGQPARFRRCQATALRALGALLRAAEKHDASITAHEQALQALDEAAATEMQTAAHRELVAEIEHSLGEELATESRFEEAEHHCRRAAAAFAALAHDFPAVSEHMTHQGASLFALAATLEQRDPGAAEQSYREAIAMFARQAELAANPDQAVAWRARAKAALGRFLGSRGRDPEADAMLREAWSEYAAIRERRPDDLDAQIGVPQALAHLAELKGQVDDEQRRDLAQRAFDQLVELASANPDNRTIAMVLRNCFQVLDGILQGQGDTAALEQARARLPEADRASAR
ncbi:MAG: protein kinase [Planctomycetota bacterium]